MVIEILKNHEMIVIWIEAGCDHFETGSIAFHFFSSTKLHSESRSRLPAYCLKTPSFTLNAFFCKHTEFIEGEDVFRNFANRVVFLKREKEREREWEKKKRIRTEL